jgi:HK97 family phage portal protein
MKIFDHLKSVINYTGNSKKYNYTRGSYSFFGFDSPQFGRKSDEKLLNEGFATNSDAYSIITRIAEKGSEIPLYTEKTNNRGNTNSIQEGDFYDMFFANGESINSRIEKMLINLCATGDLYIEVNEPIAFKTPTSSKILRSGTVCPVTNNLDEIIYYEVNECSNVYRVDPEYMIHIKFYDPTNLGIESHTGLSPLQAGYMALSCSNDLQIAGASLYKNMGASGIITDKTGALRDEKLKNKFDENLKKRGGGAHKAGGYFTSTAQIEVHELGMSSKDLELLKAQPIKLRQLCNIYGADSKIFNDPESTTFNNVSEAKVAFMLDAVLPKLTKIIEEINIFWSKFDDSVKLVIDKNSIEVLQKDQKKEAEKNAIKNDGVLRVLESQVTPNQKISILVEIWGYHEEDATKLVMR